jgi:hypothetical protein
MINSLNLASIDGARNLPGTGKHMKAMIIVSSVLDLKRLFVTH